VTGRLRGLHFRLQATQTTKRTTHTKNRCQTFLTVVTFVFFVVGTPSALLAQDEHIAEIRVHGNHTTPDAIIVDLSGLKVGDPVSDKSIREAEKTIRRSHRFSDVEVRRRYLSISDPTQVLAMIVVNEKAGITDTNLTPGVGKRLKASAMFLPIFNYQDGYGLTYGMRTTFPHVLDDQTASRCRCRGAVNGAPVWRSITGLADRAGCSDSADASRWSG